MPDEEKDCKEQDKLECREDIEVSLGNTLDDLRESMMERHHLCDGCCERAMAYGAIGAAIEILLREIDDPKGLKGFYLHKHIEYMIEGFLDSEVGI
jgi:hypothetical protein